MRQSSLIMKCKSNVHQLSSCSINHPISKGYPARPILAELQSAGIQTARRHVGNGSLAQKLSVWRAKQTARGYLFTCICVLSGMRGLVGFYCSVFSHFGFLRFCSVFVTASVDGFYYLFCIARGPDSQPGNNAPNTHINQSVFSLFSYIFRLYLIPYKCVQFRNGIQLAVSQIEFV